MDRAKLNEMFEVTEKQLNQWSEEYETDAVSSGDFGKVMLGRPRICDDKLVSVTFKVSPSSLAAFDACARKRGESRSEALRNAVDRYLATA